MATSRGFRAALVGMTLAGASISATAQAGPCDHLYGGAEGEAFQAELDSVSNSARVGGNELLLSRFADENYAHRTRMVRNAQDFVFLYTLKMDHGPKARQHAIDLAIRGIRGVEVDVVFDQVAQAAMGSPWIPRFLEMFGVNVNPYSPQNQSNILSEFVVGSHKKLLLVDSAQYGLESMIGGRNIGDVYFDTVPNASGNHYPDLWKDTDVLVHGPGNYKLVDDFRRRFNELADGGHTIDCPNGTSNCAYYPAVSKQNPSADMEMRVVENEPDDNNGDGFYGINAVYQRLLNQAQRSIDIQTPYFMPDEDLLNGINSALARGVRVRIMTNSEDANDLGRSVYLASQDYFEDLVDRGAEIYLWNPPGGPSGSTRTLHSKVLLIDQCVFAPGTYNLDGRSYTWENEYVFPITDEGFAAVGQNMFDTDLQYAGVERVDASWFDENVSIVEEAQAWFFSLFSGWL